MATSIPPPPPAPPLDDPVARYRRSTSPPATAALTSLFPATVAHRPHHGHTCSALLQQPSKQPAATPVPGHPQEQVDNVLWTGFYCHQETEEETHLQVLSARVHQELQPANPQENAHRQAPLPLPAV